MALSTYSDITNAVADWLARDDIASRIEDCLAIAELQIARKIKAVEMEDIEVIPIIEGIQSYDLPARMIEMRNIYIDTNPLTKLRYLTPIQLVVEYPHQSGTLVAYTIVNGKIKVNGNTEGDMVTPTGNNIMVEHWAAFAPLSMSNPTNWLTTNASDLLLYGTLIATEMYLGADERMPLWKGAFGEIIADIARREDRKRFSGDELQIRSSTRGNYQQPIGR